MEGKKCAVPREVCMECSEKSNRCRETTLNMQKPAEVIVAVFSVKDRILWQFQQVVAVVIAFEFAGRSQNSGIDQIGKDGIEVELEPMASFDGAADGIEAELRGKALEKEIANRKYAPFIDGNVSPSGRS